MSNIELVAINLTAEYISILTDLQLFIILKLTYLAPLIERSVYYIEDDKNYSIT
ncbi:MAG: hypothetical protein ACK5IC_03710 [Moheibacter sp.]